MRRITISNIAEALGMSRNTVSRALKNSGQVSEATKQIIIEKALEMGYAGSITDKPESAPVKPKNIMIIMNRNNDHVAFWSQIINGISEYVQLHRHNVLFGIIDTNHPELPSSVSQGTIDGIIVVNLVPRYWIDILCATGIPTVFIDLPADISYSELPADVIMSEGESSVYRLTEMLIADGHTSIGFLGSHVYCKTFLDRYKGYKQCMEEHHLPVDADLCVTLDFDMLDRDEIIEEYVRRFQKGRPTAVVCTNDNVAIHLMMALKRFSYRIPEDICVTGFDDLRECEIIDPHITSIHVDNTCLGARAAAQLFWRIENPGNPFEVIKISTRVVKRLSSDRPRVQEVVR